jgi:predicted nucleic-acid-binding Zn-ribbon protein
MKIKCSKCGKVVNKRKEVIDTAVKKRNISVEEYLKTYLCKDCRTNKK